MGTDIHAFVEYTNQSGERRFSGSPNDRALLLGHFSLSRDYALFDALGDGRNSQMAPEMVRQRALFPPRGVPGDMSLEAAREYYDLVVESQAPHVGFWPKHACVSADQAEERVRRGRAHMGIVAQTIGYRLTEPRIWHVVSKESWHTPSWLSLLETLQSLEYHRLSLAELPWDYRVLMKCLSEVEEQIGRGQVRLAFWFDS
jgi:hypothetical protein